MREMGFKTPYSEHVKIISHREIMTHSRSLAVDNRSSLRPLSMHLLDPLSWIYFIYGSSFYEGRHRIHGTISVNF